MFNNKKLTMFSQSDAVKFKNEYESLNDEYADEDKLYPEVKISSNNLIKYSSLNEILGILNSDGDAVVYLAYASCLYCRSVVSVLLDVVDESGIDMVYYVNIQEKSDGYDGISEKLKAVEVESDLLVEDGVIYSPLVIFITDGEIISYNKGTLFSQSDPFVELNSSQIDGLTEIYQHGFDDVTSSLKIKNS